MQTCGPENAGHLPYRPHKTLHWVSVNNPDQNTHKMHSYPLSQRHFGQTKPFFQKARAPQLFLIHSQKLPFGRILPHSLPLPVFPPSSQKFPRRIPGCSERKPQQRGRPGPPGTAEAAGAIPAPEFHGSPSLRPPHMEFHSLKIHPPAP